MRGSLTAVKLIYRLHAGRVFHRTGAAALVGQTLHAAGVGGLDGQGEDEPAPLALLALHPYLAAGEVDQHLADVQAEACAPGMEAPGLVFLIKALENVGQRLGADALTGPSLSTPKRMVPPAGVNLMALSSRL